MVEKKTEKLQKKTNIRIICFTLLFSLSVSVFTVVQDHFWCRSEQLPNNVVLFGEDLSGACFEQAQRSIENAIEKRGDDVLVLTYREQAFRFSCIEMGFPLDGTVLLQKAKSLGREGTLWNRLSFRFRTLWDPVELEEYIEIDRAALEPIVCSVRDQLDTTAKDAYFSVSGDGGISIVPSEKGTYLDKDKTMERLIFSMKDPGIDTVSLVIDHDADPSVTTEDLESMCIDEKIASFTTYFSESSVNRSHNILQAASAINGTILLAGETFSFNDRVGERSYERGFLDAPIIENGRYREGIGGGVCQVSTTLYGAVLRTEMEVTSRRPHSLVSNYVPPGQDAMVSWNLSDLTFVNTYKTPIYLYARCRGGELTVSIYGNSEDKKDIVVDTNIIRYIPYKTETVIDPDLPKGSHYVRSSGKRGLECSVIRTISQNGEVLKTETISHDIYAAQKEVIVSAP